MHLDLSRSVDEDLLYIVSTSKTQKYHIRATNVVLFSILESLLTLLELIDPFKCEFSQRQDDKGAQLTGDASKQRDGIADIDSIKDRTAEANRCLNQEKALALVAPFQDGALGSSKVKVKEKMGVHLMHVHR